MAATLGIETALGQPWNGSSLDNTQRINQTILTDWVHCDSAITGAHAGIVHADVRIFTPGGTLIAISSQSMVLRKYA